MISNCLCTHARCISHGLLIDIALCHFTFAFRFPTFGAERRAGGGPLSLSVLEARRSHSVRTAHTNLVFVSSVVVVLIAPAVYRRPRAQRRSRACRVWTQTR